MDKERINQLRNIVHSINYMAGEVNLFISKTILMNGGENKYASKYEVTPNAEVNFYLYNVETKTTACKSYMFEEFLAICVQQDKMTNAFSNLAFKLMDRTSDKSKDIVYIKDKIII